ncbi:MAG: Flp pilus assembly complex ATPase component TadA [Ignavibacteria bacterium]|nr:Flp pilus assembly complex ATPase component TadA [Ignavibacteria bacterium]
MSTNNGNNNATKKNVFVAFSNLVARKQAFSSDEVDDNKNLSVVPGNDEGVGESKNGNGQPHAERPMSSALSSGVVFEEIPSPNRVVRSGKENAVVDDTFTVGKRAQTPRLNQILVESGAVAKEKIEEALEMQRKMADKRRLIDILIDDLGADREVILKTIARYYSFESVDPTPVFGNKEKLQFIRQLLDMLPPLYYDMAVRHKVLPFELYSNGYDKLIVITPDPTYPEVHPIARAFKFPKYEIKYVNTDHWTELWRQLAFDQGAKQLGLDAEDGFSQYDKDESEKELEKSLEEEIGRGKLNEVIEALLVDGVRTGASDIHVIPKGTHRTEFHFRIDGRLSLWSAIADVRAEAVLTVIKDRGKNLDRFEKFLSQDGFAQRMVDNKMIRFRFSTMPIYSSDLRSKLESIVIRILRGADAANGIDSLGMPDSTRESFVKAIRKPQGIVIFTGPTGSGKSTSQLAAIQTIMDPGINIITIEDPVEYLIEGCRQVKLNHKLDFEGALRGLLRHDPDVVMVGEMRDKTTAEIAVKLANTGHLIFSTLHTNDSVGAITRLYNMGIEPFLLAYTINIVVAQRLIRKLCDRCKMLDEHVDIDLLIEAGLTMDEILSSTIYKPVGCVHCIRGYRGRIGIFEALAMTKEMRKIILKSKDFIDEDALRTLALQNGMQTLRQSAINLVKSGVTAIENVEGMLCEE